VLFSADLPVFAPPSDWNSQFPETASSIAIVNSINQTAKLEQNTSQKVDHSVSTHLVIIDSGVENHAAIKAAIESRTDGLWVAHVLDPSEDPISSISTLVSKHSNLSALHLISHGQDGELSFSGRPIDALSHWRGRGGIERCNRQYCRGRQLVT